MGEEGLYMRGWYCCGRALELAAGSTPMSWLKGLKGWPGKKVISTSPSSVRSDAKGA